MTAVEPSLALRDRPVIAKPASDRDRLSQWRQRHQRGMIALTVAALLVGVAALMGVVGLPLSLQIALLVVGVGLLGLPHGATDHLAGRAVFEPGSGKAWPLTFAVAYLGVAGLVVMLWWLWPPLALVGFLAISIFHFGQEDAEASPAFCFDRHQNSPRAIAADAWPFAIARGTLLIVGAMAWQPETVGTIFAWLIAMEPTIVAGWLTMMQPVLLAIAIGSAALLIALHALSARHAPRENDRSAHRRFAVEVALIAALPIALPALLAFVVYFCGWHSPRHFMETASRVPTSRPATAIAQTARLAIPLTVASWLLGIGAFVALSFSAIAASAAVSPASVEVVRVVFIGLSALTVPHMLLATLAARKNPAG